MPNSFDAVAAIALTLPGLELAAKRDGGPVLKIAGSFIASPATHRSAEPYSIVIRINPEDRQTLLDEAPETYYLTAYYRKHAVILVRLGRVTPETLRDLLSAARRATLARLLARGQSLRAAATR